MNYSKIKTLNENIDTIIRLLQCETEAGSVEMLSQARQLKEVLNKERDKSELNVDIIQKYINENHQHISTLLKINLNTNLYAIGETILRFKLPLKFLEYSTKNTANTFSNISRFLFLNIEELNKNVDEFYCDTWYVCFKVKLPKKVSVDFLNNLFNEISNGFEKIPQQLTDENLSKLNLLDIYSNQEMRRKIRNKELIKPTKENPKIALNNSLFNEQGMLYLEKRGKCFYLFFENCPNISIVVPEYVLNH